MFFSTISSNSKTGTNENHNKLAMILTLLVLAGIQVRGQEFHEDGGIKMAAVSTDKKYGYEPNHKTSIKVGKIENQQHSLRALRGPNGGAGVELLRI